MTDPRPLDTPTGYPILSRHAEAMAAAREPLLAARAHACPCGAAVSPALAWWDFCGSCLERIPEELRLVMQQEYRPGAKQPSAAWREAHEAARLLLLEDAV